MNTPSLLIWKSGTNPASEKRSANAWISGTLNLAAQTALATLATPANTTVEVGIFDVLLADGSLPKPGKTRAQARILDIFPGAPYHPAKTDSEGVAITDAEGRVVRESNWVVRLTLVIEQPTPKPAE